MADDDEIRAIWVKAQDIHAASEALISLAKERGGSDNITVGIVQVSATDAVQPARKVPITREIGVL
jgi:serine/threonine protein phosphatase PrpC